MSDRWLTITVEKEPEHAASPPPRPAPERRPVSWLPPTKAPRRSPAWAGVAGVLIVGGLLAGIAGAWMTTVSGTHSNKTALEAAETGDALADRTRIAAGELTKELARIESTRSALTEAGVLFDDASRAAAVLEAAATSDLPPGSESATTLIGMIDRLAASIDAAFQHLARLGIEDIDGPGEALRAAAAALAASSGRLATDSATGFGPFVLRYPLPGYAVTDPFGTTRDNGFHHGIDIGAPVGTPILAAADGVVTAAGWLDDRAGNGVILSHDHGWETRYFHMANADLPVAVGDQVTAGQAIGPVGSTGYSTGPHLHFEIVFGPIRMDPDGWFTYIGRETAVTEPAVEPPLEGSGGGQDTAPGTTPGPVPETTALSDSHEEISEIQDELREVGEDASRNAAATEDRLLAERGRTRTAALTLYAGAVALALGLLLMWLTRPRDHADR